MVEEARMVRLLANRFVDVALPEIRRFEIVVEARVEEAVLSKLREVVKRGNMALPSSSRTRADTVEVAKDVGEEVAK